jgi:hypothetical protein
LKIGSPRLDFPDWAQTRRLVRAEEEVWTEERKLLVLELELEPEPVLWPAQVPEVQGGLPWSGQARRRCGIGRHRPFL